jgi:hypothetical protein
MTLKQLFFGQKPKKVGFAALPPVERQRLASLGGHAKAANAKKRRG